MFLVACSHPLHLPKSPVGFLPRKDNLSDLARLAGFLVVEDAHGHLFADFGGAGHAEGGSSKYGNLSRRRAISFHSRVPSMRE